MYSIIVHGGVGVVSHDKEEAVIAGVRGAVLAGSNVLASSGPSLNAVQTAIKVLEDNPLFNSGTGSVLTFNGEVEMDAAVAYGPAPGFGAIADIKSFLDRTGREHDAHPHHQERLRLHAHGARRPGRCVWRGEYAEQHPGD